MTYKEWGILHKGEIMTDKEFVDEIFKVIVGLPFEEHFKEWSGSDVTETTNMIINRIKSLDRFYELFTDNINMSDIDSEDELADKLNYLGHLDDSYTDLIKILSKKEIRYGQA